MSARFPYVAATSAPGDAALLPLLPLELQFKDGDPVQVRGLIDSGSTVNVLPYGLGIRLGAVWERQTTAVKLTGNLAMHEARAILLQARVADFAVANLVLAGTRADNVPLLLGQVNFFRHSMSAFTVPAGNSRSSRHGSKLNRHRIRRRTAISKSCLFSPKLRVYSARRFYERSTQPV